MKKIYILVFMCLSSLSPLDATTLVPNLNTQMAQQEQINIKNTYALQLATQANKRAEARIRFLNLKSRNLSNSTSLVANTPSVPHISLTASSIIKPALSLNSASSIPSPQNVDMNRIRSSWIGWYNDTRSVLGLGLYTYDTRLDSTAYDWNRVFANGKGLNHHTRNPGDAYYDYAVMDAWFMARGINPIVRNRVKHVENVGYGRYSCNSSDCTDSLIRAIRSTFDFFMSEKGKAYDAHYRSIVQPNFSKIGISVIVVPSEQRYYLTVHYITE